MEQSVLVFCDIDELLHLSQVNKIWKQHVKLFQPRHNLIISMFCLASVCQNIPKLQSLQLQNGFINRVQKIADLLGKFKTLKSLDVWHGGIVVRLPTYPNVQRLRADVVNCRDLIPIIHCTNLQHLFLWISSSGDATNDGDKCQGMISRLP